jgi:metal-sulfur cluster biosynthetic enzyme
VGPAVQGRVDQPAGRPVGPELQARVEAALRTIEDPCSESLKAGWSVFDLGLLVHAEPTPDDGLIVELTLTDPMCPFFEMLEERVCAAVSDATGHERVAVQVSSHVAWDPGRLKKGRLDTNG